MVRGLLVLLNQFRITRSLGARLNTASDTSDTPLHCPRRTKLTKSIELGFDVAPAQNFVALGL